MPRVYDSSSDPIDFCRKHFPSEETAWTKYGNVGDGPDGRGNCFGHDAAHPGYDEDPGFYRCVTCNRILTDRDN